MKSFGGRDTTTPLQLLREGKAWLSIFEKTLKETDILLPAFYCFFTALEFHLKAYVVLRKSKYADTEKLKNLQHNFLRIYEEIVKSGENELTREIKTQLKKYELFEIDINKLKYPEDGRMWSLERGFEKGDHTINSVFQKIDNEVTLNSDQWLIDTYPKKTRVSAFTHINYQGDIEKIDLGLLSNTCSECLPANLQVFEEYNYPWQEEMIFPRNCVNCKNLFDPKGFRQSFWE